MPDGPGCFGRDSSCPALLRARLAAASASRTGLSPPAARLSMRFRSLPPSASPAPLLPRVAPRRPRFGLLRFRSPLLAESLLFSFPAGTGMFRFPALAPPLQRRYAALAAWVPPFGHPRINGHSRLPGAFILSFWLSSFCLSALFLCFFSQSSCCHHVNDPFFSVENKGLEPLTPCLQGRCSKPSELIPLLLRRDVSAFPPDPPHPAPSSPWQG